MVKELVHDPIFLAEKSELATKEDLQAAQDLLDTLMVHKNSCVGTVAIPDTSLSSKAGYQEAEHYKITKQFIDMPERMVKYLLSD